MRPTSTGHAQHRRGRRPLAARIAAPLAAALLCSAAHAEPEMIPVEIFEAAKAAAPTASALDVPFPLQDGGTFSLAAERGHPVLLSFWASWCSPCRRELPALARWAPEHPDVKIVAVNVDRTRPEADRFLKAVAFDLPVAFDPDAKVLGAYGAISMPTMFLFDSQGELVWRHAGYSEQKGFAELEAVLKGVR